VKFGLVCLLAIGCQSTDKAAPQKAQITADDCPRFLAKARRTIEEMGHHANLQYTPEIEASALKDCLADVAAGKPMVLPRCVLDATSEAAVHACFPTYDSLTNRKAP